MVTDNRYDNHTEYELLLEIQIFWPQVDVNLCRTANQRGLTDRIRELLRRDNEYIDWKKAQQHA